jgi:hypothetical protein
MCRGGTAQGEECGGNTACPGTAGPGATPAACTFQGHPKYCANAPLCMVSGQSCTDNLDCARWPEPTPVNYCPSNQGLNLPAKACNVDADCGRCVAGSHKGWACTADSECPSTTCDTGTGGCIIGVQQGQDEVYSQGSGLAGDVYADYVIGNQTCESCQEGIVSATTARAPVALKYFRGLDKLVHVMSVKNTVRIQGWDAASTLNSIPTPAPISWFLGAIDIDHGLWENIPGDVSGATGHMSPNSLNMSGAAPPGVALDPVTDSFWVHDADNIREYSSSPHSKDLPTRVLGYSDFTGWNRTGTICHAGSNDGTACYPSLNCPGGSCYPVSGVYTCHGGSNDGNSCDVNASCTGGGICVDGRVNDGGLDAMPRCNGAMSFGTACTSNGDCSDGTCTTSLIAVNRWLSRLDLWVDVSTALSGQPPDYFVGQIDGVQGSPNQGLAAPTGATLSYPVDVVFDSSGNILTTDAGNNRVLRFPYSSKTGASATLVFGAADFTHAGTLFTGGWVSGITADPATGQVSVTDTWASRVDVFDPPFTSPVTGVSHTIGQAACTGSHCNQSSDDSKLDRLWVPRTLSTDGNGGLYVGDSLNNRDLHFPAPLATDEAADLLLGQLSATAYEQLSAHTESDGDSGGLCFYMANGTVGGCKVSTRHNRALCWNDWYAHFGQRGKAPETDAVVLGQPDGTTGDANHGGLSAASLSAPYGCAADSSYLYVADSGNHRITKYLLGPGLTDHQSAADCIGQASPNPCTKATPATSQTGLNTPVDVKVSAVGNLWIVDQGNRRTLLKCEVANTDQVCTSDNSGDSTWDLVLDQGDYTHNVQVCTDPASASRPCVPWSVVAYGATVLVADASTSTGGARIQMFDQPWSNGMDQTGTLGQVATNRLTPRGGVCVGGPLAGTGCDVYNNGNYDWFLQGTASIVCPYGYCSGAVLPLRATGNPISMGLSTRHLPAHLWVTVAPYLIRWASPFYTGEAADLETASNSNHAFNDKGTGYVPSQPDNSGGAVIEAPDGSVCYSNGGEEGFSAIYCMMDPDAATPANAPTATVTSTDTPTDTPTNTVTPTNTPTGTATPTSTEAPTATPSETPTSSPSATPTPTPTPTHTSTSTPTNTPSNTPTATTTARPTLRPCVGDCNQDGSITVGDILTMVNIALGSAQISDCLPGDVNGDGKITVDEILTAVNNALNGCHVIADHAADL